MIKAKAKATQDKHETRQKNKEMEAKMASEKGKGHEASEEGKLRSGTKQPFGWHCRSERAKDSGADAKRTVRAQKARERRESREEPARQN